MYFGVVTLSSGKPLRYLLKNFAFIVFLYLIVKECFPTAFLPFAFHVPVIQFPIRVQAENRRFSVSVKP